MFSKKGFTLVGFAIVVAIIGILAAIAIPNFVAMQYRAKRAEVPSNVGRHQDRLVSSPTMLRLIPTSRRPPSTPLPPLARPSASG